jgi:2-polyprenyl-3-methyl-5-hydroxy-6-metoxy-1,4-benzoquinol methylase
MTPDDINVDVSVCPACRRVGGRNQGSKNDFRVFSCESCATLYTVHLPGVSHSQDYDSYYTAENLTVPAFVDRRLDEIVPTFEPYRKNNRLLDVGFGAGSFLEAAARNNWQALGVEVSQSAVEHVRERGFEVFCGELEKAAYPDDYFDVVILSEVLEHVPDPMALLEASVRVLRPGGLLWATTPHGRGISARLLGLEWSNVCPPDHLQLFSVAGTEALLSGAGLRRLEIATHGTNPFEILHSMRARMKGPAQEKGKLASEGGESFNRVESSYQLNEFLSDSPLRRFLKGTLNSLLNVVRMGDSLKIRAEK